MILCILYLIIFAALAYGFMKLDCNPLLAFYERFFPNKDKLRGKTVWVVGASTGIGEELAYQLAELNCRLILTSTTESKLQEVKQNCLKRSKGNLKSDDVLVSAYDISDFKQNETAFKQIIDKFGKLDVLVCNAARVMISNIVDDDVELQRKIFDINFFSHMQLSKIAVRHWVSTKSKGLIMATSSIGAYSDLPFYSAYTCSKKALQGFYRDLSLQHNRDGITVVVTCPGPVKSELGPKSLKSKNERPAFKSDQKMEADRCAELIIISMANGLSETWISIQPFLLLTYLGDFFHHQMFYICKFFNVIKYVENHLKIKDD